MSRPAKINLLEPISRTDSSWNRRRIARVIVVAVVLLFAGLFTATAAAPGERFAPIIAEFSSPVIFRGMGRLFLSNDKQLAGESEDRVNILLLGIGGEGHDGPELTDTIILLSYKPSTREIAMLSIPRDMVVEIPGYGWRKVNAVNAYAEANQPGSGGEKTAALLSQILGVPINYYVRIDFAGFEKVVDEVGGVLVYVDRPFTDSSYPAPRDLYQIVSFKSGWQRMDGERALVYARSRHGNNGEGSDFARSARQQKIMLALKEELLSTGTLANPGRLSNIYQIAATHVQTNFQIWELLHAASLAEKARTDAIIHKNLDPESSGALVPSNVNGAYMLVPPSGNYNQIQKIAQDIFSAAPTPLDPGANPNVKAARLVGLEIQNGTALTGFGAKVADALKNQGFKIGYVGNAKSKSYDRSVIYDLSGGKYEEELLRLRKLLDADVSVTIPEWFTSSSLTPTVTVKPPVLQGGGSSADFLVILGKSSVSLFAGGAAAQ